MSGNERTRYDADIVRALRTPGGHLSIGRGGFTLHYEHARLSGYDCDVIKAAAVAAGLLVIDSRRDIPRHGRIAARGSACGRAPKPAPLPRPARTRGGEGVQQSREGKDIR